jgi:hypothetical protein
VLQDDPTKVLLMKHENGIALPDELMGLFKNSVEHDPADLSEARDLADRQDVIPIGLFYYNKDAERYDAASVQGLGMTDEEKLKGAQATMDRFLV